MASLILPEDVREAAYALYAFCRLSDDAVDVEGGRLDSVARLRRRLDGVYAGRPELESVDRALADAVIEFAIPRAAFDALLEGLEWDAAGRRYETLSDLYAYAARVAGSVGAMMAALMGARSPDLAARACDLGVAMQLTNIARDVGEDARNGRLYLPRAWLREVGLDPDAWLADPVFCPQIAKVVSRLLESADELYARADSGIANLDPKFRPAIMAARRLYADIGHLLRARGLDSVNRRTTVSAGRKIGKLMGAGAEALWPAFLSPVGPALPETRFLVDAVAMAAPRARTPKPASRRRLSDDLVWTVDLFTVLEMRGRAQRALR